MITENDIPFNIKNQTQDSEADNFDDSGTLLLSQVEKRHILRVLNHFKGNKTKAADALGITVKTLYNKLASYDNTKSLVGSGVPSELTH